jgi:hypothetical protein
VLLISLEIFWAVERGYGGPFEALPVCQRHAGGLASFDRGKTRDLFL